MTTRRICRRRKSSRSSRCSPDTSTAQRQPCRARRSRIPTRSPWWISYAGRWERVCRTSGWNETASASPAWTCSVPGLPSSLPVTTRPGVTRRPARRPTLTCRLPSSVSTDRTAISGRRRHTWPPVERCWFGRISSSGGVRMCVPRMLVMHGRCCDGRYRKSWRGMATDGHRPDGPAIRTPRGSSPWPVAPRESRTRPPGFPGAGAAPHRAG